MASVVKSEAAHFTAMTIPAAPNARIVIVNFVHIEVSFALFFFAHCTEQLGFVFKTTLATVGSGIRVVAR